MRSHVCIVCQCNTRTHTLYRPLSPVYLHTYTYLVRNCEYDATNARCVFYQELLSQLWSLRFFSAELLKSNTTQTQHMGKAMGIIVIICAMMMIKMTMINTNIQCTFASLLVFLGGVLQIYNWFATNNIFFMIHLFTYIISFFFILKTNCNEFRQFIPFIYL